jgi:hypothetical protein
MDAKGGACQYRRRGSGDAAKTRGARRVDMRQAWRAAAG